VATFAEKLKSLRKERGWSQERLARDAGISTSFVAKLEQSTVSPSLATAQRLAKSLGVELTAFAEGAVDTEKIEPMMDTCNSRRGGSR
jgi:transcriptional regulator with XRE-family HTH domain